MVNRKTRALHTLARAMGDGEVVLARVKTDATGVTELELVEPSLPSDAIPRAMAKIRDGQALRVNAYGTSLVENGRSGWLRMTLGPGRDAAERALGVAASVDWDCHAVGGANAHYTIALMGEPAPGSPGQAPDLTGCDLAIVALLPNGGENRLALFEAVVRHLRAQGIEVLLLTDNVRKGKGQGDPFWQDGEFVRAMADRYGCALADTAAYMLEAEQRGLDIYRDSIHQNALGHRQWAEAVAGVLVPGGDDVGTDVTQLPAPIQTADLIPARVEVDFAPEASVEPTSPVSENRIALYYGLADAPCWDLGPGESLTIEPESAAQTVDLIFDASSGFTANLLGPDGAVVREVSYEAPAGSPSWAVRPQTRTLIGMGDVVPPEAFYELAITDGHLRLYAVSTLLNE